MQPRIINIRKNILEENDYIAHTLRNEFQKHNVLVVNMLSSPGAGKTELITTLCKKLIEKKLKVCAIVGDLATDNDAKRIKKSQAEAYQINTNGNCHLDANMIKTSLEKINWRNADIIFIENVGNLVCPASFDLGESVRIIIMSVTEGEDKPSKYPTIFNSADICVISKIDLAKAVNFNEKSAIKNIKNVNQNIKIIKTSSKTTEGIETLIKTLLNWKKIIKNNEKTKSNHA